MAVLDWTRASLRQCLTTDLRLASDWQQSFCLSILNAGIAELSTMSYFLGATYYSYLSPRSSSYPDKCLLKAVVHCYYSKNNLSVMNRVCFPYNLSIKSSILPDPLFTQHSWPARGYICVSMICTMHTEVAFATCKRGLRLSWPREVKLGATNKGLSNFLSGGQIKCSTAAQARHRAGKRPTPANATTQGPFTPHFLPALLGWSCSSWNNIVNNWKLMHTVLW